MDEYTIIDREYKKHLSLLSVYIYEWNRQIVAERRARRVISRMVRRFRKKYTSARMYKMNRYYVKYGDAIDTVESWFLRIDNFFNTISSTFDKIVEENI